MLKKFELQKFHKGQMPGRVDILWRIFWEKQTKKLKMKSQDRINIIFWPTSPKKPWKIEIFWVLRLNFFLIIFLKNDPEYIVILAFMNFFLATTFIRGWPLFICWYQKSDVLTQNVTKKNYHFYIRIQLYQPVEHKMCISLHT